MSTGLLHLHNILRWVILISAHITLLLGLFQYFTSDNAGFKMIERMGGMGNVMKDTFARFWVVEHISVMLISIVLITIARRKAKTLQYKQTLILLILALVLIIAAVPWPFRDAIQRPLFPGM
jgi:phosphoglycerol transferase MdoB-like AlkP superfamily enzyme